MKLRSIMSLLLVPAFLLAGMTACEWSTSSDDEGDVTYDRFDKYNFSGTYYTSEEGARISSMVVQQDGQLLYIRDNRGGTYSGKITKISSNGISTAANGSSVTTASFQCRGTSRGRPATLVGTFSTAILAEGASSGSTSCIMGCSIVEEGGSSGTFTGTAWTFSQTTTPTETTTE